MNKGNSIFLFLIIFIFIVSLSAESLHSKIKKSDPNKNLAAETLVKEAQVLEVAGKWEEANYKWDEIQLIGRNDYYMKECESFKKRWKISRNNYKKKIEKETEAKYERKTIMFLKRKANSAAKRGDFKSAQEILNKIKRIAPDEKLPQLISEKEKKFLQVDKLIDSGEYDKALKLLRTFSSIQEQSIRPFKKFLKIYKLKYKADKSKENLDALIETYKMRIAMTSMKKVIYRQMAYLLGKLYYENGFFKKAYYFLNDAIEKSTFQERLKYNELWSMYKKCKIEVKK